MLPEQKVWDYQSRDSIVMELGSSGERISTSYCPRFPRVTNCVCQPVPPRFDFLIRMTGQQTKSLDTVDEAILAVGPALDLEDSLQELLVLLTRLSISIHCHKAKL